MKSARKRRIPLGSGVIARIMVGIGSILLAVAAAMVSIPAGLAVAGAATVLSGLFLVDVEGASESPASLPLRPPR